MINRYSRGSGTAAGRAVRSLALAVGVLCFASASEAGPLGLGGPDPDAADIYTPGMTINYDAGAGLFTATALGIGNYIPGFADISDLDYSLSATVDNDGMLSGGQLAISGHIADLGLGGPGAPISLLTGTLKQFGSTFENNYSVFELLFEVDSQASGLGFGTKGGIILHSWDLSSHSFASSFGSTTSGGDAFSVPEPATLLLLGLGAAGAGLRRRFFVSRH